MRLHSRQIKPGFWNDTDLITRLTRDGRLFYIGLWQLCDDSGCLFDDPFQFRIHLFPNDNDMTPEILADLRDQLIALKKAYRYEVAGKVCIWLSNFHKHQKIPKEAPPGPDSVPLPPWIRWVPSESGSRSKSKYEVITSEAPDRSRTRPGQVADTSDPRARAHEPEPEPEPEPYEEEDAHAREDDRQSTRLSPETLRCIKSIQEAAPTAQLSGTMIIAVDLALRDGLDPPLVIMLGREAHTQADYDEAGWFHKRVNRMKAKGIHTVTEYEEHHRRKEGKRDGRAAGRHPPERSAPYDYDALVEGPDDDQA
jgi:hypothetical protein